jgi:hypothetical protein
LAGNHYSNSLAFYHNCGIVAIFNTLGVVFFKRLHGALGILYEILDDYVNSRMRAYALSKSQTYNNQPGIETYWRSTVCRLAAPERHPKI